MIGLAALHPPSGRLCRMNLLTEEPSPIIALSEDALELVAGYLCHPVCPEYALSFARTCHVMAKAMLRPLSLLRPQHEAVKRICFKAGLPWLMCAESRLHSWTSIPGDHADLTQEECTTVSMLVRLAPSLVTLELGYNLFGDEGLRRLSSGLREGTAPALTTLKLVANRIGNAGAHELASAIGAGALPQLSVLNLTCNDIGDSGLVALAPPLRSLRRLTALLLDMNVVSDEGVAVLVEKCGGSDSGGLASLEALQLGQNLVGDAGCDALTAAIERCALPTLRTVHLAGGTASSTAQQRVTWAIYRNRHAAGEVIMMG